MSATSLDKSSHADTGLASTTLSRLNVLVRREFWEHRSLWMVPIAIAAFYLFLCLIPVGSGMHFGPMQMNGAFHVESGSGHNAIISMQYMFTVFLYAVMSIIIFFYLADCLYAERKDRSILFWKSLPVSDVATVLTKLAVALLIVPLGVFLVGAVANVVAFGILAARFHNDAVMGAIARVEPWEWLQLNGVLFVDVFMLGLWYAPIAAYQMFISAWAKSSVSAWTILPPIALAVAERYTFGTKWVSEILLSRLSPGHFAGGGGMAAEGTYRMSMLPTLTHLDTWVGVAVAAAFLYAAIRVRRHRDDT